MEIFDQITNIILSVPMFKDPKYIIFAVGLIIYFLWEKFAGKKPYCLVRIKEKQGDTIIDHGKIYKGHIKKIENESGKVLKWLFIEGINKVWRLPKNTEFTPSGKIKLLELLWFGKNTFQVLKVDPYMYKRQEKGLYKKQLSTENTLKIVPEDLKYMDYELSTKIDNLTTNKSWLQGWLDKNGTLFLTLLFCFLMVWVTVNKLSVELGATRDSIEGLGSSFTNMVMDATSTKVDDNTVKGEDLSKIGASTNKVVNNDEYEKS